VKPAISFNNVYSTYNSVIIILEITFLMQLDHFRLGDLLDGRTQIVFVISNCIHCFSSHVHGKAGSF
jgi:drug/metabolite transporter superfamily protein YnfA